MLVVINPFKASLITSFYRFNLIIWAKMIKLNLAMIKLKDIALVVSKNRRTEE